MERKMIPNWLAASIPRN